MEGRRCVVDGVWMMGRKEDHVDHKREVDGWHMGAGEKWSEGDVTGEGTTQA
jgi:hypothetical protein